MTMGHSHMSENGQPTPCTVRMIWPCPPIYQRFTTMPIPWRSDAVVRVWHTLAHPGESQP